MAMAAPMPTEAPVTRATRPCQRCMILANDIKDNIQYTVQILSILC